MARKRNDKRPPSVLGQRRPPVDPRQLAFDGLSNGGPPRAPKIGRHGPDISRNRHRGNPESTQAFTDASPELWSEYKRRIVSEVTGTAGLTSDELAIILDLPTQTVSARTSELKRDQILAYKYLDADGHYERRRTRLHCWAGVLILYRDLRFPPPPYGRKKRPPPPAEPPAG